MRAKMVRANIFLCIFGKFLCKCKKWWPRQMEAQKIPNFFGGCLCIYTALDKLPKSNSTLCEIHDRLVNRCLFNRCSSSMCVAFVHQRFAFAKEKVCLITFVKYAVCSTLSHCMGNVYSNIGVY